MSTYDENTKTLNRLGCSFNENEVVSANEAILCNRVIALEKMMVAKLDLIKCGIAANYSGSPYENKLYTDVVELLNET